MQRHRFYASPDQLNDKTAILDSEEAHHLTRVLRLGVNDLVFVFDGEGNEWQAEVSSAGKHEVELRFIEKLSDPVDSPLRLTLGQALIKGDKFDWVIQKATELGASRVVPLITGHGNVRRVDERIEHKLQRWRRIALEAVKQCGRRRIIEIAEPVNFADFCRRDDSTVRLLFSERGGRSMHEVPGGPSVSLAVGPEGGWSDSELELAEGSGFIPIHLGGRILRTETAAVVAVALAQHLFGDL